MDVHKKRLLIYLSIFVVVLGILVISTFMSQKKNEPSVNVPQPTIFVPTKAVSLQPTLVQQEVRFTGDKEEAFPEDVAKSTNKAFELRQKLPITTANFSLSYDYKNAVFTVVLFQPVTSNKVAFNQWIIDNGYAAIAKEKFIFKEQ